MTRSKFEIVCSDNDKYQKQEAKCTKFIHRHRPTSFWINPKCVHQGEVWDRAAISLVSACRSPAGEIEAGGALINGAALGHLDISCWYISFWYISCY